jgi:hypothetical protein
MPLHRQQADRTGAFSSEGRQKFEGGGVRDMQGFGDAAPQLSVGKEARKKGRAAAWENSRSLMGRDREMGVDPGAEA